MYILLGQIVQEREKEVRDREKRDSSIEIEREEIERRIERKRGKQRDREANRESVSWGTGGGVADAEVPPSKSPLWRIGAAGAGVVGLGSSAARAWS